MLRVSKTDFIKRINFLLNKRDLKTSDLLDFFKDLENTNYTAPTHPKFFTEEFLSALKQLIEKTFPRILCQWQIPIVLTVRKLNLPLAFKIIMHDSFESNFNSSLLNARIHELNAISLIYVLEYFGIRLDDRPASHKCLDLLQQQLKLDLSNPEKRQQLTPQISDILMVLNAINFKFVGIVFRRKSYVDLNEAILAVTQDFIANEELPLNEFIKLLFALANIGFVLQHKDHHLRNTFFDKAYKYHLTLSPSEKCMLLHAIASAFPALVFNFKTKSYDKFLPSRDIVAIVNSLPIKELENLDFLQFMRTVDRLAITIDRLNANDLNLLQEIIKSCIPVLKPQEINDILHAFFTMKIRFSSITTLRTPFFERINRIFIGDATVDFNQETYSALVENLAHLGVSVDELPPYICAGILTFFNNNILIQEPHRSSHARHHIPNILVAFMHMNFRMLGKQIETHLIEFINSQHANLNARSAAYILLGLAHFNILNQDLVLQLISDHEFSHKEAYAIITALDLFARDIEKLAFFEHALVSEEIKQIRRDALYYISGGFSHLTNEQIITREKILKAAFDKLLNMYTNVQRKQVLGSVVVDILLEEEKIALLFENGKEDSKCEANNRLVQNIQILSIKGYKALVIPYNANPEIIYNSFVNAISAFKANNNVTPHAVTAKLPDLLKAHQQMEVHTKELKEIFRSLKPMRYDDARNLIYKAEMHIRLKNALRFGFTKLNALERVEFLALLFCTDNQGAFKPLVLNTISLSSFDLRRADLEFLLKLMQAIAYLSSLELRTNRNNIFSILVNRIMQEINISEAKPFLTLIYCLKTICFKFSNTLSEAEINILNYATNLLAYMDCNVLEFNKVLFGLSVLEHNLLITPERHLIVHKFLNFLENDQEPPNECILIIYALCKMQYKFNNLFDPDSYVTYARFIGLMSNNFKFKHFNNQAVIRFAVAFANLNCYVIHFSVEFQINFLDALCANIANLNAMEFANLLQTITSIFPSTNITEVLHKTILDKVFECYHESELNEATYNSINDSLNKLGYNVPEVIAYAKHVYTKSAALLPTVAPKEPEPPVRILHGRSKSAPSILMTWKSLEALQDNSFVNKSTSPASIGSEAELSLYESKDKKDSTPQLQL